MVACKVAGRMAVLEVLRHSIVWVFMVSEGDQDVI